MIGKITFLWWFSWRWNRWRGAARRGGSQQPPQFARPSEKLSEIMSEEIGSLARGWLTAGLPASSPLLLTLPPFTLSTPFSQATNLSRDYADVPPDCPSGPHILYDREPSSFAFLHGETLVLFFSSLACCLFQVDIVICVCNLVQVSYNSFSNCNNVGVIYAYQRSFSDSNNRYHLRVYWRKLEFGDDTLVQAGTISLRSLLAGNRFFNPLRTT